MSPRMGGKKMNNAVRSGIVVVGAIAFGWLTLQVGFKPFLEKAQLQIPQSQPPPPDLQDFRSFSDSPSQEEFDTIEKGEHDQSLYKLGVLSSKSLSVAKEP